MKKDFDVPKLDGENYDVIGSHAHRGLGYIFDERKLLYMPIPKSASDSFRRLKKFTTFNLKNENGQKTLQEKRSKGYKFVTVFRHPIKRFTSIYLEVMHRPWDAASDPSVKLFNKYRAIKDVKQRLNTLLDDIKSDYTVDPHFAPQTFYAGGFSFDYVFDIEKLGELKQIGITLPHTNSKPAALKQQAKNEIQASGVDAKIREIYKNDFEIYKMIGGSA
jgi:hypothetical protein